MNSCSTYPLAIPKKNGFNENFGKLPSKTFIWSPLFKYLCKLPRCTKDHSLFITCLKSFSEISPCILWTICLFRCFFYNSILFRQLSVISFNFCSTSLWLFIRHILKATGKSRHWHVSISIGTAKFHFSMTNFFEKTIHLWPIQLLCSIIWHQYHFTAITHLLIFIGVLGKKLFEFLEHRSISNSKTKKKKKKYMVLMKILGNFPIKHSFGVPYSSTFANFLGVQKTTRFERFTSILDMQKKACPRNFRRMQRCVHVTTCLIWLNLY